MDYRKKKNLIWKGESFLFFVVLLVFGAIFAAIHTGGLIQKQDSVQLLNKGWYYIKDGKKQEITLPAEIPAKTGEKLRNDRGFYRSPVRSGDTPEWKDPV